MENNKKKLLVIDGHNYLYRAYYGLPPAITLPDGHQGNAVYGFFAFLRKMIRWTEPVRIIVVFDSETGILDKQSEVEEYKQGRKAPDSEMFAQLSIIQELLRKCNVPIIESPDHEADDIIGSLVSNQETRGHLNYISSADHDFLQLVTPDIKVVREVQGKFVVMGNEEVYKKHKINSSQYIDYLALKGDSSDNIPGIFGIGAKTAQSLLNQYRDIPSLFHPDTTLPDNLASKLEGKQESLLHSRKFLKINTDIPLSPWDKELQLLPKTDLLLSTTNEIIKLVD
jgi:DNA polymerase I